MENQNKTNNTGTSLKSLEADREKVIVRTSVIGIVTNLLLAGFKAVVGIISNSIAITLDAVNNTSDALSSVITIVGAKLGGKAPDKKHPLGYGRIEYLSSMTVAAIILYAGITSAVESVKKIIHPEEADYRAASLVIVAVAIAVKLILGSYVKKQGEKVNSGALTASGSDALFDAVLSASVLASAAIYMLWHISLEAYVGVLIAAVIIKAGIEMMSETVSDILGQRADPGLVKEIKSLIAQEPEVIGAYDLVMNNYGPNKNYASVHMELPDTMTVEELDRLTRRVEAKVYLATGVILTGVGVYSHNTGTGEAADIRNAVQKIVLSHDWALQMHGFYVDTESKTIRFDAVVSFDIKPKEAVRILCEDIKELYPDYTVHITPDIDLTDL
jgi:cation diffusion facilitator family transporter